MLEVVVVVLVAGQDVVAVPLALSPGGSVRVAAGVDVAMDAEGGGVVFLWGMAAWCWVESDVVARRLAAVQLVESGQAGQRRVAELWGVDETTLWRWRRDYESGGASGLSGLVKGPKGPWKVTEEMAASISLMRSGGASLRDVASRHGVSTDTVRRVEAASHTQEAPTPEGGGGSVSELVPLARPAVRDAERQAARRGELSEAEPQICEGSSLPLVGALVILPALAATGLLDAFGSVFRPARAAFYGIRSLVLTMVFAALVGEPRVEGLSRIDPVDLGRLLGLDRAPEVRCMRVRIAKLAEQHRGADLFAAMAATHADTHAEAMGVLYVDGHVRAYHGKAKIPKAHVARLRLSMPAEADTWIADTNGDGVLVWQSPPSASLVSELRHVTREVRTLLGDDAHPTIAFDRGGWSPKLFAELHDDGFHILTYRKGPKTPEARTAFTNHTYRDAAGTNHTYLLADRAVRLSYNAGRRRFTCRQITRLDPTSGHQTQIITTRDDTNPALIAHAMFSRWRQENFFRYMRCHYALDALDSYETTPDDEQRLVTNPARLDANRDLREALQQIHTAEAAEHRAHNTGKRDHIDRTDLDDLDTAFTAAYQHIEDLRATAASTPTKIQLGDLHPDAARLNPERKRIHDAIRLATYNAESCLARLLTPHYARANQEARSLLREIYTTPADLEIRHNNLHITINPLSAPRRTRALTALCEHLTATQTTYPGTNLTLTYTVKTH